MICKFCAGRDHAECLGCCCQHVGSGVRYLDKEARHALMLAHAAEGRLVDPVVIRLNGSSR